MISVHRHVLGIPPEQLRAEVTVTVRDGGTARRWKCATWTGAGRRWGRFAQDLAHGLERAGQRGGVGSDECLAGEDVSKELEARDDGQEQRRPLVRPPAR
jgi:hypothetical protein